MTLDFPDMDPLELAKFGHDRLQHEKMQRELEAQNRELAARYGYKPKVSNGFRLVLEVGKPLKSKNPSKSKKGGLWEECDDTT